MSHNISDERAIFESFTSSVPIYGEVTATIYRADGTIETKTIRNIVTANGLNEIAKLASGTGSAAGYLAIGTVTAAGSLGSTDFGEVIRKAGAVITNSKSFIVITATYGGAADSITSLALETAAICNHASSGSGVIWNLATGVAATLANSDTLNLTSQIRCGSHDL